MRKFALAILIPLFAICLACTALGSEKKSTEEPLVDLKKIAPGIVIDLKYATSDNATGAPLYPADMRCWVRHDVALRLRYAQAFLEQFGYGLKIWDGWRPAKAHSRLYATLKAKGLTRWVERPGKEGSLHSWGIAVDATMVDAQGKEVPMPSGFDEFSSKAALRYRGGDPEVAKNLRLLQAAMKRAGFVGMSHEWWHFVVANWAEYLPEEK